MKKLMEFIKSEDGANAPECALILALVAGVIIVVVGTLGTNIQSKISTVAGAIGP
jgi:Flp pilus assembly pilin Flp